MSGVGVAPSTAIHPSAIYRPSLQTSLQSTSDSRFQSNLPRRLWLWVSQVGQLAHIQLPAAMLWQQRRSGATLADPATFSADLAPTRPFQIPRPWSPEWELLTKAPNKLDRAAMPPQDEFSRSYNSLRHQMHFICINARSWMLMQQTTGCVSKPDKLPRLNMQWLSTTIFSC